MIGAASAPASSGNLGPGFDTIALALGLRCTVTAEIGESMTVTEDGSTKRLADDDMIAMAVRMAAERPMHLTINNEIPRARGLGSSSAVTAAAAAAALKATNGDGGREFVFTIVDELEGHADNAAAAVYGGLVAATSEGIQTALPPPVPQADRRHPQRPSQDERRTSCPATRRVAGPPRRAPLHASRSSSRVSGQPTRGRAFPRRRRRDSTSSPEGAPVTGDRSTHGGGPQGRRGARLLVRCWSRPPWRSPPTETAGRVIGAMSGVLGAATVRC